MADRGRGNAARGRGRGRGEPIPRGGHQTAGVHAPPPRPQQGQAASAQGVQPGERLVPRELPPSQATPAGQIIPPTHPNPPQPGFPDSLTLGLRDYIRQQRNIPPFVREEEQRQLPRSETFEPPEHIKGILENKKFPDGQHGCPMGNRCKGGCDFQDTEHLCYICRCLRTRILTKEAANTSYRPTARNAVQKWKERRWREYGHCYKPPVFQCSNSLFDHDLVGLGDNQLWDCLLTNAPHKFCERCLQKALTDPQSRKF